MRVNLRSAGFPSFLVVCLKTGSYWAEESLRPVGPGRLHPPGLYEPAVLNIRARLQAPAAYTLWTVH